VEDLRMATNYSFQVGSMSEGGLADIQDAAPEFGRSRSLFSKYLQNRGSKTARTQEIYLATKQCKHHRQIFARFSQNVCVFELFYSLLLIVAAQSSRCLAESSEIDIETGPYFGGLITVEHPNTWSNGFKDGDCAVRGDPTDPKSVYTLSIDHNKCGSQTSNSAVTTFVIVQENLPILTHSTKRFMVVCNYSMPDSFTVKAA
jgi:hypothetical protein